jgi:membrane protein
MGGIMTAKDGWRITKQAVKDFFKDDAMTLSAALAFYAGLSLAPLVVLLLWASSFLGQDTQERVVNQAISVVGPGAGEGIRNLIKNAQETPNAGTIAGIIGIVTLVLAATGVFGQLQRSLNLIWDVQAKGGALTILFKRLVSLLMVMGIWVLLLAAVVMSAVLSTMGRTMQDALPGGEILWQVVDFLVPLFIFIPVFALLFKFVPDVRIKWRDVWVGATVTAVLFVIGKLGLGLYLGRGGTTSAYGAAGAFMALLLWVYYSSLIIFLGAEITQCWARYAGSPITPAKDAQWLGRDKPIGRPKHDEDFPGARQGRPRPA